MLNAIRNEFMMILDRKWPARPQSSSLNVAVVQRALPISTVAQFRVSIRPTSTAAVDNSTMTDMLKEPASKIVDSRFMSEWKTVFNGFPYS